MKSLHHQFQASASSQTLNRHLKQYLSNKGIQHFVVTCYLKEPCDHHQVVSYDFFSETMRAWHQYYHEQGFDKIDLTTRKVKLLSLPQYWIIEDQIQQAKTLLEKQLREDSAAYGIREGLSIPMLLPEGDNAILMLAFLHSEPTPADWSLLQYELLSISHYYFYYLKKLLLKEKKLKTHRYALNQRQQQCLELTAQNYSVTEIATKLSISERTVNYHMQKLNKQLGTTNKYMSVAKAQREKLID